MRDQALKILSSTIPATQYAINYLNQNIAKPFMQGMNEQPGQQPLAFNSNADLLRSMGNAFSNATPEGLTGATGGHALSALSSALPIVSMGIKDDGIINKAANLIKPFTGENSLDQIPDMMRSKDINALDTAKDILKSETATQNEKNAASDTIQTLLKDYAPEKADQGNMAIKALDQMANQTEDLTKNVAQQPLEDIKRFNSPIEALNSPEMQAKWAKVNEARKLANSKVTKTSNNLYHTTPAENLDSIIKNGLTTGNKPRFEGVSSPNKISFSANEAAANYYGGSNDIMIRTKTSYKPSDLQPDLLAGGEGVYVTGKNIPPSALEAKINGKWVSLDKLSSPQQPRK